MMDFFGPESLSVLMASIPQYAPKCSARGGVPAPLGMRAVAFIVTKVLLDEDSGTNLSLPTTSTAGG